MFVLHRARQLTRFVLVWFVLAMGVATASPMVNPKAMDLVCATGGGMKVVVVGDDEHSASTTHTLDCPLCATLSAPPPVLQQTVMHEPPLAHALRPMAAARLAAATAPPLPSRGPPLSL